MDVGALTSGLVTGLREGVEAALIIAIICAYLAKTGNKSQFPLVFLGAGTAIGLSAILGILLYVTVGGFEAPYEQLFEAATLIARGRRRDVDAVLDAAPGALASRASSRRRSIGRSTRDRSARSRCSRSSP